MFRTIIWFIYFWLYMVVCIPMSIHVRRLENRGNMEEIDRAVNGVVKKWARRMLWMAGATVSVTGRENLPEGAFVAIANHQGNFDIPIMLSCVGEPRGLIAKQELAKLPAISGWMRHLHCLFVDRSSPRAGAQIIIDGAQMLQEGHSLTIFPEGTRSKGGPLGEFKAGAFRIAARAGVPIVPVTIDGSYKLMEANGVLIRPAAVKVTVHPPIETKGASREVIRTLPETVRDMIASAL